MLFGHYLAIDNAKMRILFSKTSFSDIILIKTYDENELENEEKTEVEGGFQTFW